MANLKHKLWEAIFALIIIFSANYMRLCIVKDTLNPYNIRIPKININFSFEDEKTEPEKEEKQDQIKNENIVNETQDSQGVQKEEDVNIANPYIQSNEVTINNTNSTVSTTQSNTSKTDNNITGETIILMGD